MIRFKPMVMVTISWKSQYSVIAVKEFIINTQIDEIVHHGWFHGCATCTRDPKLKRATHLMTWCDFRFELLFSGEPMEQMNGQRNVFCTNISVSSLTQEVYCLMRPQDSSGWHVCAQYALQAVLLKHCKQVKAVAVQEIPLSTWTVWNSPLTQKS